MLIAMLLVSVSLAGVTVGDTTFDVIATVKVADAPHGMCFSPDGGLVYVACAGGDRITVLDAATHEVVRELAAGQVPLDVILAPTGQTLLATQFSGDLLLAVPLDGAAPTAHLTLTPGPSLFSPVTIVPTPRT